MDYLHIDHCPVIQELYARLLGGFPVLHVMLYHLGGVGGGRGSHVSWSVLTVYVIIFLQTKCTTKVMFLISI